MNQAVTNSEPYLSEVLSNLRASNADFTSIVNEMQERLNNLYPTSPKVSDINSNKEQVPTCIINEFRTQCSLLNQSISNLRDLRNHLSSIV